MRHSIVILLVLLLGLPAGADAKRKPPSPLPKVSKLVSSQANRIGKQTAREVHRKLVLAGRRLEQDSPCGTLKAIGQAVHLTKDVDRVAQALRDAQKMVYERFVPAGAPCELDKPTFSVSGNVRPAVTRLGARKVARMDNGHGMRTDFVADELVLKTAKPADAKAFAKKWNGRVVRSRGPFHLLQVEPTNGLVDDLGKNLLKADPAARGKFKVSSGEGRRLLALAADAAAKGMKVGPNFLARPTGVLDRSTGERPDNGDAFPADAFQISYNKLSGPDAMGTGEAWRTLAIAGRLNNRVPLAIVDGGFSGQGDWPESVSGADGVPNPTLCSSGNPCRWHGTNVASAAAGVVDNGQGVAGAGGQVADLILRQGGGDEFTLIDGIYEAFEAGAKVINISSGWELDASVSVFNVPVEDATQTARQKGALVIASAGNDGRDVDAEDCAIVCWEEEWIAPCENDAVLCVGGLDTNGKRAGQSNYGYEWCGDAKACDVDVFGPWTTWVGPDPDVMGVHRVSGTSFSAPFVSGVAAMMLAANPKLTPAQVEAGLIETATASADQQVSRVVNAYKAVVWAFQGQHIGPAVVVPRPGHGSYPYGGFNSMHFDAKLYTVGEDPSCCTVRWSVDGGPQQAVGAGFDWVFGTPGEHTVTATATDGKGGTGSGSTAINAYNVAPAVAVTVPADGDQVYRGQPQKFQASATDLNDPLGLPCDSVHWVIRSESQPSEQTADGCQPEFTFATVGTRDAIVTATDAHGEKSVTVQTFSVVEPPPNSPPLVTILSPDAGESLPPNQVVELKASAGDPDGTETVTGTWTVTHNGSTKTIGTGNEIDWTPKNHVSGCGPQSAKLTFSATDSHGTSIDEVTVYVDWPVC